MNSQVWELCQRGKGKVRAALARGEILMKRIQCNRVDV